MDDIIAQKYAGSKLLKAVWLLLYFVVPAAQGKNMREICNRRRRPYIIRKGSYAERRGGGESYAPEEAQGN